MHTLFTTAGLHPRNSFTLWRETLFDQCEPIEQQRLDDSPFAARLEIAEIGPLVISRIAQRSVRSEATPTTLRRRRSEGMVCVAFVIAGGTTSLQDDRCSVQGPGDIVVLDQRPGVVASDADSQYLFFELPRSRLESVLGPTRLYTALTLKADAGSTFLAQTFFRDLIGVRDRLDAEAAARMAEIGTDLIVASFADRLAREVPRTVHGSATVQRAKAFVEANLADPSLDPPQLAAAVGVSLRRLQELFHERGRHISEYIWDRRLTVAAERLADPGGFAVPIGVVAYECGFTTQAHFSRRFKARHGLNPRDYRSAAVLADRSGRGSASGLGAA